MTLVKTVQAAAISTNGQVRVVPRTLASSALFPERVFSGGGRV